MPTFIRAAGRQLLDLLGDLDMVLGSDDHFLLGTWLESAKALATNDAERKLYEYNARNQITLWGPDGNVSTILAVSLKAKKRKNNNEGFDNLHIILLIHVYAFAKKC